MEMDSIKQMVIEASTTLYNTQDKEQRRTAEQWLNDFKKSVHAWYITDQILHTDKNEQVLFFAAQTIRTKIQYNFHELPLDSHEVNYIFVFFLIFNHYFLFSRPIY
jgi:transportin-3